MFVLNICIYIYVHLIQDEHKLFLFAREKQPVRNPEKAKVDIKPQASSKEKERTDDNREHLS